MGAVEPLLLGIQWMDPNWLLAHFGNEFVWISLAIVFVECGLLFPVLPGDTLLFAIGLFIAGDKIAISLPEAIGALLVAAVAGNLVGYEIGRALGPPLAEHDGRILKRAYITQTSAFFERHGNKALVIGRFVPVVRTFVTVVAGVTRLDRRRFLLWSLVGALLWVLAVTLLGYFLGAAFPSLGNQIDKAILLLVAISLVPIAVEWWRHRRHRQSEAASVD